jgi:predicted O-linked N-acetylglucosamine transferase (SPINDLY family)
VKREDDTTAKIRQAVDGWRSTLGISDDALSEQIRRDGIDILVDLSGHSEGHRLLVFARKPAPVQVTAWGHSTGTGLKTIDYFFADPSLVPQAERQFYAEEIFDLPSALCYEAPPYAPEVSALPATRGTPFTFGCLNRLEKITDKAIALWGRILRGVPDSHLLVKDKVLGYGPLRQQFLHRLRDIGGIAPERASLLGPTSHLEHLATFGRIDVGLDPMPQGGGVSTAEALYMGVPIVALRGTTVAGRLTASVLSLLQMQDWVAETEDDYVRIATQKREDLDALAGLRRQLRTRLTQSPYGDVENYVRAVERAYRSMWRRWCDRARRPGP